MMMRLGRLVSGRMALSALLFLFLAGAAQAQQTLGSVNGTVLDSTGAAVPGSTVTVTDPDINLTRTTKASSSGYFQVFNLPVGVYKVTATHDGFSTTDMNGISIKEAQATTLTIKLKVGEASTSVDVTANPMLNASDSTNGYTMDAEQIALTPLATGSFTQLAVLAPGTSAELLSGLGSTAGLGNQPIWANGQRDTSNTLQVDGVDSTNLFNGKTSSSTTSQRYNFGIGTGGPQSAIGGAIATGVSVFGSNGNSLPTPPPEFLQEVRVNTSLYDAQQGATSGAQIDANTNDGTNNFHGQLYGSFANNDINAAPFFFRQQVLLAQQGVGAFPASLANPALHRWTAGATLGGPIKKDKLFFFVAYQHLYASDEASGLSQFNVPTGLSNDRSNAGLVAAATSWNKGTPYTGAVSSIASGLFNATLPNGAYLIPSAQTTTPYAFSIPNVTLIGVSVLDSEQANAAIDYAVSKNDRLSVKYFYQNAPVTKPYGYSQTGGFPQTQDNRAELGVIDNTISLGSRFNWEQRVGYVRMVSYSYYNQTVTAGDGGNPNYGVGASDSGLAPGLPGLLFTRFAVNSTAASTPSLTIGPYSSFVNMGYFQNRINPSTNVIAVFGKHIIKAGSGYSYTQLNIDNNRGGHAEVTARNFSTLLAGSAYASNVLETTDSTTGKDNADRYYRSNEIDGYAMDTWRALSNLSINAGVRYDYHGGFTEKYGNMFNFDPTLYNVTGTSTTGFTVNNDGFIVAGNNALYPTQGVSDSTLTGRQWGISPRLGFAWSPKTFSDKVVVRGGFGMYYDRGELFGYLSQPAGGTTGGPFGVTESAPLTSYVTGKGTTLADPIGSALPLSTTTNPPAPNANPASLKTALQTQLNTMTGSAHPAYGPNCGGVDGQENYKDCTATLNFGAYDKNNVLPYTISYSLNVQWQLMKDLAVTIGYTGNRGRHAVIPIPFNLPQIATPTNPIHGETSSYGYEVLNQNNPYTPIGSTTPSTNYLPIASEPWDTGTGGNTDFRAPYVGYNPNAALFETVGVSAYDALETHLEKRLSHGLQAGVSYTWSHALDEQSDIGTFFTGDDPSRLRDSYSSADFDRTNILVANFQVQLHNFAQAHSLESYFTNDWTMTGIGVVQSGEPYSLYEYYGAVGSIKVGNYPNLMNPVLPIKNGSNPKSALTGNSGAYRGVGGSYIPAIDPSQIAIDYLQPGQKGIPVSTGTDPQDTYETDFVAGQRNIFRQATQKRVDLSFRKTFHVKDKVGIQYAFNVFNVTNTTSLDVPNDTTQIRQDTACSNTAAANPNNNCGYLQYGQIATSLADQSLGTGGRGTAGANLDQLPAYTGSGNTTNIATTNPVGVGGCTSGNAVTATGCPNNGAKFGSVSGAIGSSRAITMSLHIVY